MHIWNITTKKNLLHTVNHLYCSISRRHLTIYYFKTTFIVSSLVGHTSLFSFSQKSTCCPAAWRVISQRWITSAFDSKCLLNLHYFGNQRTNELFLLICSFFSFRSLLLLLNSQHGKCKTDGPLKSIHTQGCHWWTSQLVIKSACFHPR